MHLVVAGGVGANRQLRTTLHKIAAQAGGQVFFPREAMNPVTMRPGTLEDHAFDGAGEHVEEQVVDCGVAGPAGAR